MRNLILLGALFSAIFCSMRAEAIDFETEKEGVKFKLHRAKQDDKKDEDSLIISQGSKKLAIPGNDLDCASGFSYSNKENLTTNVSLVSDHIYPKGRYDTMFCQSVVSVLKKGISFPAYEKSKNIEDLKDPKKAALNIVYAYADGSEKRVTQELIKKTVTKRSPKAKKQICIHAEPGGLFKKAKHYSIYASFFNEEETVTYTHSDGKIYSSKNIAEDFVELSISFLPPSYDNNNVLKEIQKTFQKNETRKKDARGKEKKNSGDESDEITIEVERMYRFELSELRSLDFKYKEFLVEQNAGFLSNGRELHSLKITDTCRSEKESAGCYLDHNKQEK